MKYRSRQHVIVTAQAAGSTAQTFKGAARFQLSSAVNRKPLWQRGEKNRWQRSARFADHWRQQRPVERMQVKAEAICEAAGLWTLDAALATLASVNKAVRIPVPACTQAKWRAQYPRRQNWDSTVASIEDAVDTLREINHGRYSSRCTYNHYTYQPVVTSYAIILNNGACIQWHWAKETPSRWKAPRGYRWDRDRNGLRIVSLTDQRKDYHPDADELRSYDARVMAKKAADLFAKRQETAKKAREEMCLEKLSADERTKLIAKAEREGCMVCMADSLRAGNCRTGTEAFAQRHNLDPRRHYKPTQLLRIANGQADRVKLAVAVALRRHRHEMTVGYALLEEHRA